MMKKIKPIVGITMGDASGVGPEIICKIILRKSYKNFCEIVIIADKYLFDKTIHYYRFKLNSRILNAPEDVYVLPDNQLGIINIDEKISFNQFKLGVPDKNVGRAALLSIDKAVELCCQKKIDAMVTAPVNKELLALSHKHFIGHTEYIANKLKADNFNMMMVSSKMKIVLVTTHQAIKNVSRSITKIRIKDTVKNTFKILKCLGYQKPKIAVLGLNPHCGDGGLFGNEEEKIIIPAIAELNDENIYCEGPFPADSFFYKYERFPVYDAIVAMYHDQGLIPFKMHSFSTGINATIGLPIVRTSVDHGPAYDIAGKNKASDKSLFEALKFAVNLSRREK